MPRGKVSDARGVWRHAVSVPVVRDPGLGVGSDALPSTQLVDSRKPDESSRGLRMDSSTHPNLARACFVPGQHDRRDFVCAMDGFDQRQGLQSGMALGVTFNKPIEGLHLRPDGDGTANHAQVAPDAMGLHAAVSRSGDRMVTGHGARPVAAPTGWLRGRHA